jgi:hypothetical protein
VRVVWVCCALALRTYNSRSAVASLSASRVREMASPQPDRVTATLRFPHCSLQIAAPNCVECPRRPSYFRAIPPDETHASALPPSNLTCAPHSFYPFCSRPWLRGMDG